METLYETYTIGHESFYWAKYVRTAGKTFRMICKIANGDPCGFKTNRCLEVMNSDGEFKPVVDCTGVGYPYQNEYYSASVTPLEKYRKGLFKAFENFITKVYETPDVSKE